MDRYEFADAAEQGRLDRVQEGLRQDTSLVNVLLDSNDYPLHVAASQGHLDVVKLLLEHGADVNGIGFEGKTPLHYAVEGHYVEIVKLLISKGADLNLSDKHGVSPLAAAAREYNMEGLPDEEAIFDLLQNEGAYYDLIAAAFMCDLERVEEILADESDAPGKVRSAKVLLWAIAFSDWDEFEIKEEILELLYKHGFRPPLTDIEALTEACAVSGGMDDMAEYLRELAARLE